MFLSGVLSAQQQPEASSRPAQSQQQTNPAPDPSSLRAIFNEAVEIFAREKAAGADAEQRKEDREKSDLAAQWEQSWWAQVAAVAACIALFVNLVHASGPTSGALVTVGPGIELELKDLRMDDGLTEEDLLNLRNQQLALVVFGRAQYVDAFGRDQTTNFKTLVEECAKGIIKLSPSVDGNDAT